MMDLTGCTLVDLLDALAARLADKLAERDASLVSQRDRRGLGGRRHIEAVRRRIARGEGGAWIVGRDYLLSPAALRDELARYGAETVSSETASGETALVRAGASAPGRGRRRGEGEARASKSAELERMKRELAAEIRRARGKA